MGIISNITNDMDILEKGIMKFVLIHIKRIYFSFFKNLRRFKWSIVEYAIIFDCLVIQVNLL